MVQAGLSLSILSFVLFSFAPEARSESPSECVGIERTLSNSKTNIDYYHRLISKANASLTETRFLIQSKSTLIDKQKSDLARLQNGGRSPASLSQVKKAQELLASEQSALQKLQSTLKSTEESLKAWQRDQAPYQSSYSKSYQAKKALQCP